jgi:hypothetical protein
VSFCRSVGFSPRVEQEAVQMQTIVSLVSAGLGGPDPRFNAPRAPGVVYRSLRETSPQTEILAAWRRGETAPALVRFLESVQKVVGRRVRRPGRKR